MRKATVAALIADMAGCMRAGKRYRWPPESWPAYRPFLGRRNTLRTLSVFDNCTRESERTQHYPLIITS
jgi:hypothetical protein